MTDGAATLAEETESDTEELADELFRVAEDTAPDGRVRVEILELNKRAGGDEIAVTARLPSLTEFTERLAYPERDDPEYKFVRLCRAAGYSLSAAEQLDGATVEAEQDDDGDWQFVAEREPTRREQVWPYLKKLSFAGSLAVALLALPLTMGLVLAADEDDELAGNTADKVLGWLLITGLWFTVGRVGYILLTGSGLGVVPI